MARAIALTRPAAPPLPASVGEPVAGVRGGIIRKAARAVGAGVEWLFGTATLVVGLAALAVVPVVQLMSLGYLLESSARVARSGRLRDGLIGVRQAALVGGILLGGLLVQLPLWLVSDLRRDAALIEPGGSADQALAFWGLVLAVVTGLHIVGALVRGGRLRHFLVPTNALRAVVKLFDRRAWRGARDATWQFAASLRLPHYFWLGARGLAAGLAWLALPVTVLLASGALGAAGGILVGLLAGLALAFVVLHLPMLQTQLAFENRFRAAFRLRRVRDRFRRAPVAFWLALAVTLLFAIPLYLLKIEVVPREAAWLPSLVFVLFIWPARLLCGWAMARADRREQAGHFVLRWLARLSLVPVVLVYVAVVYLSQYTSWSGAWSLYEQHAFLVPVQLLGM